jgi:hypothetical protein
MTNVHIEKPINASQEENAYDIGYLEKAQVEL